MPLSTLAVVCPPSATLSPLVLPSPSSLDRSGVCSRCNYAPVRYGWASLRLCFPPRGGRSRQVVRMAPEEEKMTRRSPLDFPIEWERPKPGRRPDIFPQFSPMKTPLPPPLPADPPEEDEEEEEKKEEEEEDPEKEEPGEKPEKQ
ncbi:hypothetical protein MLD38_030197 [Melastoma candidum]|uniref:Uncharacterized protein n=1 Tax=Melastoma candidum TaxID=119954 RepID=A0ACB9MR81_9MYRT|nr:hypothetical protein MLD38_030197 [Melastoma candidum]